MWHGTVGNLNRVMASTDLEHLKRNPLVKRLFENL